MLSLFQAIVELLGFEEASEQVRIGEHTLRVEEVIAEGGYAYVHIAVDKDDPSSLFALKRITCHCRCRKSCEMPFIFDNYGRVILVNIQACSHFEFECRRNTASRKILFLDGRIYHLS